MFHASSSIDTLATSSSLSSSSFYTAATVMSSYSQQQQHQKQQKFLRDDMTQRAKTTDDLFPLKEKLLSMSRLILS
jgi:hypothetical protein